MTGIIALSNAIRTVPRSSETTPAVLAISPLTHNIYAPDISGIKSEYIFVLPVNTVNRYVAQPSAG
jgi:hypothetical protein